VTPNMFIAWLASVPFDPAIAAAITTSTLLAASLVMQRLRRQRQQPRPRRTRGESLDTVQAWMPEPSRVLNAFELQALELARCAAPESMVLAQVPLSRFLKVPTRHSYSRWLSRVGHLNAGLLLCDAHSQVIAVIDVRANDSSERSSRRHARVVKVLRAAGISVLVWHQDRLPSVGTARAQFAGLGVPARSMIEPTLRTVSANAAGPRVQPPDLLNLLAEGDAAAAVRRTAREAEPVAFERVAPAAAVLH
jgi:hypothetical protein